MISMENLTGMAGDRRETILNRATDDIFSVFMDVRDIVLSVKETGDEANIAEYSNLKADVTPVDLKVHPDEIQAAYDQVDSKVVDALKLAAENIQKFHQAQMERDMWATQVAPGIIAGRMTRPIDIVGAYIPGGRAAYPSSVLMNVIPAKVAGVGRLVAATPPGDGMKVPPVTLVAMDVAGADEVYKLGGPWAVGSMAYGTATVPRVDKIVGPGSRWVLAAKMAVFGQVDIDSPAGPSEGLILADDTADPELLAVDFFTQLEHDPDAASVLVCTDGPVAQDAAQKINDMAKDIPRKEIVTASLRNSAVLKADNLAQAIDFANEYAAEHLQIITADPWTVLPRIKHAGSIFMGPWAPIPVGDYASGTNHVLPTGRTARMFSGLSVDDFMKKSTFQYLDQTGLDYVRDAVVTLAEAEGLPVHAEAVRARFRK